MTEPRGNSTSGTIRAQPTLDPDDAPLEGMGAGDVGAVYPEQIVAEGQRHGYVGNVRTYTPPEPGVSNAPATAAARGAERLADDPDAPEGLEGEAVGTVTHDDTGDRSPEPEVIGDRPTQRSTRATAAAEDSAKLTKRGGTRRG